eukprot:gene12075-12215_t
MPHPYQNCARLEVEDQRSHRLSCLLRKDVLLRGSAVAVVYGCLTWTQLTQLMVLSWPYAPVPAIFSQVVAEHVAQQQGLHKAGSAALAEPATSSASPVLRVGARETAVPAALPTSSGAVTCQVQPSTNSNVSITADCTDCGNSKKLLGGLVDHHDEKGTT